MQEPHRHRTLVEHPLAKFRGVEGILDAHIRMLGRPNGIPVVVVPFPTSRVRTRRGATLPGCDLFATSVNTIVASTSLLLSEDVDPRAVSSARRVPYPTSLGPLLTEVVLGSSLFDASRCCFAKNLTSSGGNAFRTIHS